MSKKELADVEVIIHHETDRAILVSTDGNAAKAEWVPKSVTEIEYSHGNKATITLPERMAIDKGLI